MVSVCLLLLPELFYCSRNRAEKRNKFTITLRTKTKNGLLLWANQGSNFLGGDFLALAIVDGQPELSFSLGSNAIQTSGSANPEKPFRLVAKVKTFFLLLIPKQMGLLVEHLFNAYPTNRLPCTSQTSTR